MLCVDWCVLIVVCCLFRDACCMLIVDCCVLAVAVVPWCVRIDCCVLTVVGLRGDRSVACVARCALVAVIWRVRIARCVLGAARGCLRVVC